MQPFKIFSIAAAFVSLLLASPMPFDLDSSSVSLESRRLARNQAKKAPRTPPPPPRQPTQEEIDFDNFQGIHSVSVVLSKPIMFPPCQEQFKHEVPKISAKLNGSYSTNIRYVHPDPSLNARIGLSRIYLTFRMARPEYIKAMPTCDCGILKPVLKAKESLGRYFYMCGGAADSVGHNGEKKPFTCRFFQWLDHPIPPEKSEDNKK